MSGTSQATSIVSGAAAVCRNMNTDATALEIKYKVNSTCTCNQLRISTVVPSSFADQSPNCLLLKEASACTHVGNDNNSPYRVLHSVPSSEVITYFNHMKNNSYALTYIHHHIINSSIHYSLIFKYMAAEKFITGLILRRKEWKMKFTVMN